MRRGDNTDHSNPDKSLSTVYGHDGTLQPGSFYHKYLTKALDEFKNTKTKFLIFSGGSRSDGNSNISDIEWCKKNFKEDHFLFSENNSTMVDFSLIVNSDHNIMSHLSSFGWWAAYLNPRSEKKVVAPLRYHSDRPNYTHRPGFYPEGFILK